MAPGSGVVMLYVLGSPALSAPRGAWSPDLGIHTLPPYGMDLSYQLGIQVREGTRDSC